MVTVEAIRKARESIVIVGGRDFTIRRPTDNQFLQLKAKSTTDFLVMICECVVDWDLTEMDLIPGGTNEPVKFDKAIFREWIEDNPMVWPELNDAIFDAYRQHSQQRGDSEGKSDAG